MDLFNFKRERISGLTLRAKRSKREEELLQHSHDKDVVYHNF